MTDLLQRVENSIQSRLLLQRGDRILVAVSGGPDSMVLLRVLEKLSAAHKWKIVVAHFNHRLRGRASDADEKLVRKTAAKMKLPIVVESADVKAFAGRSKLSVEMAARKLRHEFFARAAQDRKIKTVALAHHADDQVELFFLRLLRGAGGEGLAGMKWRSPSPADNRISLVRPLLDCAKAGLLAFARENKTQFHHDATNSSPDFLRNRIRTELLPLLRKKYQPGLNKAVLRLMEIVGAESEFVSDAASLPGKTFDDMPVAVQRRVLCLQLAKLGVVVDFDLVEQLRRSPGVFVSVGAAFSVCRKSGGRIVLRGQQEANFSPLKMKLKLGKAGETFFGGLGFKWQLCQVKNQNFPAYASATLNREFFDAGKIGGKIILRHWRPGDRFQPIGLRSAAKLQDLFTNAKISRERRRSLILAESAGGEIFWVEGLRIGEHFKLTPQTKRRLLWTWQGVHLPVAGLGGGVKSCSPLSEPALTKRR